MATGYKFQASRFSLLHVTYSLSLFWAIKKPPDLGGIKIGTVIAIRVGYHLLLLNCVLVPSIQIPS
jgi:hypothetical protein